MDLIEKQKYKKYREKFILGHLAIVVINEFIQFINWLRNLFDYKGLFI